MNHKSTIFNAKNSISIFICLSLCSLVIFTRILLPPALAEEVIFLVAFVCLCVCVCVYFCALKAEQFDLGAYNLAFTLKIIIFRTDFKVKAKVSKLKM